MIGGGLAGPEAALTAARLGCAVDLYEMRAMVDGKPRLTPAHQTTEFGELVCSNSLKSESPHTAPWLLKQEMRRARSALLRIADEYGGAGGPRAGRGPRGVFAADYRGDCRRAGDSRDSRRGTRGWSRTDDGMHHRGHRARLLPTR